EIAHRAAPRAFAPGEKHRADARDRASVGNLIINGDVLIAPGIVLRPRSAQVDDVSIALGLCAGVRGDVVHLYDGRGPRLWPYTISRCTPRTPTLCAQMRRRRLSLASTAAITSSRSACSWRSSSRTGASISSRRFRF